MNNKTLTEDQKLKILEDIKDDIEFVYGTDFILKRIKKGKYELRFDGNLIPHEKQKEIDQLQFSLQEKEEELSKQKKLVEENENDYIKALNDYYDEVRTLKREIESLKKRWETRGDMIHYLELRIKELEEGIKNIAVHYREEPEYGFSKTDWEEGLCHLIIAAEKLSTPTTEPKEVKEPWLSFDANKVDTYPTVYGSYIVCRKDGKMHFETYNGTGWAYNHKAIIAYFKLNPPTFLANKFLNP